MKIFKGNNLQEIEIEIDQTVGEETSQDTITRIEIEIKGTEETITGTEVEMTVEIEI